jgi:hypothetical protein
LDVPLEKGVKMKEHPWVAIQVFLNRFI